MAADNKSLGKFTLDGIPPAPRGIPQIEVTFDIDADGILKVNATDKATNRSQHITITASSGLNESEVEQMRKDAERFAEEDRKKRELVEARNTGDNAIYSAEKLIRENGDRIPEEKQSDLEQKIQLVKQSLDMDNAEMIKESTSDLLELIQQVGTYMHQQPAGEAQPSDDASNPNEEGDDFIEGEFKEAE